MEAIEGGTERRVYVADLAAYNAGRLRGAWVEVSDPETMQAAISAMLADSPEHGEEYAIHDYDGDLHGFASQLGENPDLTTLCDLAAALKEHGAPWAAYARNIWGGDLAKVLEGGAGDFEESYNGEWRSEEDFAEDLLRDSGDLDPDSLLARYFDYEAFARDLFRSDYWSDPAPGGGVFVFRNI